MNLKVGMELKRPDGTITKIKKIEQGIVYSEFKPYGDDENHYDLVSLGSILNLSIEDGTVICL